MNDIRGLGLGAGLLLLLASSACSTDQPDGSGTSDPNIGTHASAVVSTAPDMTTLVFGAQDRAADLARVASGERPKDFPWIAAQVPNSLASNLRSLDGVHIDLAEKQSGAAFLQVYGGPCNPALRDFSTCLLLEQYTSGETGLTGTMVLRITDSVASGSFDVTWEGDTDRFGEPVQWVSHETSAGYSGPVAEVPSP